MMKKVREQDFPSRADYAAALSWWQIIAETWYCMIPSMEITPPEHYGRVKKWLIDVYTEDPFKPAWRFWAIWLFGSLSGIAALGFLTFSPGVISFLVFVALWVLTFVNVFSVRVLLFRAGCWETMLEQRDERLAKRAETLAGIGGWPANPTMPSLCLSMRLRRAKPIPELAVEFS